MRHRELGMVSSEKPPDDHRYQRLSELLKKARRSIPIDAAQLGNRQRVPGRMGKLVSQEEIAEVIGVSRVWYAVLESGRPVQASISLLGRICDALMLDEQQRGDLFYYGASGVCTVIERHIAFWKPRPPQRATAEDSSFWAIP
jgi:transcriptional regulator with XRE-family HTH domain